MSRIARAALALAWAGAALAAHGARPGDRLAAAGGPESAIAREDRFAATAEVNGCALDLGHPAPGDDALRLRVGCPLSLDDLLQGVDRLLATAGPDLPAPASLALGRIVEYPWLVERLARAALADPGWDAARGRPRTAGDNAYVAGLLERGRLVSELADRFAAEGFALRVAGVEKVLAGAVGEAPELRALADAGVDPAARLPFDAQLWLRVEPVSPAR